MQSKVTLFLSKLALMKIGSKIFILLVLITLCVSVPAFSQDNASETKTEKKNDVESRKIKRKKAKKEWKAKRQKSRQERHAVKSHEKRLQTKATRKRMKKDRAKANRNNQNKKEFFLIRLFRPKPRTGAW
jgi:ABC-type transport system involved in cytochrome bd biosynthesis fused ATPase/permease subunit